MTATERLNKIKKVLLGIEPEGQEAKPETTADPVEEVAEVKEEEATEATPEPTDAPTAEPVEVNYSEQIESLLQRIESLESASLQFSQQLTEEQKKTEQYKTAFSELLEVVEKIADEPSAEPAQTPRNAFYSDKKQQATDRQSAWKAAFQQTLKNNK